MATFKDNTGRTWTVDVTVPDLKPLRAVGVELGKLLEHDLKGLAELLDDPERLVAALFVLCAGQADKAKVSEEDFARAIAGDVFDGASEAFVTALADFSPRHRRTALKALAEKTRAVMAELVPLAMEDLAKLDPKKAAEALLSTWKSSAGSSPASSESTPEAPG